MMFAYTDKRNKKNNFFQRFVVASQKKCTYKSYIYLCQVVLVEFVRSKCNWTDDVDCSRSLLMRAVGIFLTNGVNQGQGGRINSQGLYPTFSFISHR